MTSATDTAMMSHLLGKLLDKTPVARQRRRTSAKRKKGSLKKKKTARRWSWHKFPANAGELAGLYAKIPKKGYLVTPLGRYVRDTVENRAKYTDYAPGATNVAGPPQPAM